MIAKSCPRHWQLPKAPLNAEDKAELVDKSFYEWLNSYGWGVINWDQHGGTGIAAWTKDDYIYNIYFWPFFSSGFGYYSPIAGQANSGLSTGYWSETSGEWLQSAQYASFRENAVVPALKSNSRYNAISLRCLTQ